MKHDKMKKQRASEVVPVTAVGRAQTRRVRRSGSEVAGWWGQVGIIITPSYSCCEIKKVMFAKLLAHSKPANYGFRGRRCYTVVSFR